MLGGERLGPPHFWLSRGGLPPYFDQKKYKSGGANFAFFGEIIVFELKKPQIFARYARKGQFKPLFQRKSRKIANLGWISA